MFKFLKSMGNNICSSVIYDIIKFFLTISGIIKYFCSYEKNKTREILKPEIEIEGAVIEDSNIDVLAQNGNVAIFKSSFSALKSIFLKSENDTSLDIKNSSSFYANNSTIKVIDGNINIKNGASITLNKGEKTTFLAGK